MLIQLPDRCIYGFDSDENTGLFIEGVMQWSSQAEIGVKYLYSRFNLNAELTKYSLFEVDDKDITLFSIKWGASVYRRKKRKHGN